MPLHTTDDAKRFVRELRILRVLHGHESIVTLLDVISKK